MLSRRNLIMKLKMKDMISNFQTRKGQGICKKKQSKNYWDDKENVIKFLQNLKEKLNLQTDEDWKLLTAKKIKENRGSSLLNKYSMIELKKLGNPEQKNEYDHSKHVKPPKYWENEGNINLFIMELKDKFNLNNKNDWNLIKQKTIQENGGSGLLNKLSIFEIRKKGIEMFHDNKKVRKWENKDFIENFISKLKENLNLHTMEDWNLLNTKQIKENGGKGLLEKYSLYEIKCFGFPNGKNYFKKPAKSGKYWENNENVLIFLNQLKQKLNLNEPEDWNLLTKKLIKENDGHGLLNKYSLFDIKCLGCPEGKLIFTNNKVQSKVNNKKEKSKQFWNNDENIQNFLHQMKEKLDLNTPTDWNELTRKKIQFYGGNGLLNKYSLFEIKTIGCPEGNFKKTQINKKPLGFWDNYDNIQNLLMKLKEKYHLNSPEAWNLLNVNQIKSLQGHSLLNKYSLFDIKCLGCPEGKFMYKKPRKSLGYWDKKENIQNFLHQIKEKLNLNTPNDWNELTFSQIQFYGGNRLLSKYSIFELKCMGCPEGKSIFHNQVKSHGYWNNHDNIQNFLNELKIKFNLNSMDDWNRISMQQIRSHGGFGLCSKYTKDELFKNHLSNYFISNPSNGKYFGRSSQRWLFLQVQKLFPREEIVEDYFHSEISRETGFNVQFDIFLIHKNIAIEYHGKQHFEDIPSGFSPLELYQSRDIEKEKLCKKFNIQLIIIPYWWDNTLDSLRTTITSKLL